jgi:hypothetical protein
MARKKIGDLGSEITLLQYSSVFSSVFSIFRVRSCNHTIVLRLTHLHCKTTAPLLFYSSAFDFKTNRNLRRSRFQLFECVKARGVINSCPRPRKKPLYSSIRSTNAGIQEQPASRKRNPRGLFWVASLASLVLTCRTALS